MLELDLTTVLWQAVNFLILATGLYFVLFKPAIAGIKTRTEDRERALDAPSASFPFHLKWN